MGSALSERDRQLIDDAVAKGKVKKIPQGASAFPGYVFDPTTNRVVSCDQEKANGMNSWKGQQKRSQRAKKKRMELLALLQSGMSLEDAAKKIERSYNTAHQYMMILSREGYDVGIRKPPRVIETPRVFLAVSRFFCGTVEDLAERLGTSRSTMLKAFKEAGQLDQFEEIKANVRRNRKAKTMSEDETKLKAAKELFKNGYGYEDVAVLLDLDQKAAREIMMSRKEKGSPPK